jgi:hypothetical protein
MVLPEVSDNQRKLLQETYDGFRQAGSWPTMAYIDLRLDQDHGLDANDILNTMPAGLVHRGPNFTSVDSRLVVTAAGLAFIPDAAKDLENFLRLVRACAARESECGFGPLEIGSYSLGASDSDAIWSAGITADEALRALAILQVENLYDRLSGIGIGDSWEVGFGREIRRYRDLTDLADYISRRPQPSDRGWTAPPRSEPYVFVLMPFGAAWSDNVYDAIRRACDEAARAFIGLRAERADDITEPGRITDQITSAIERADVLIADITGANPNVLFELGYGDALGKSIIVLNQHVDATPFDIKDWRQITYAEQLLGQMGLTLVDFLTGTLLRAGFVRRMATSEASGAEEIIG